MSYRQLAEALLQNRPYFGPALRSLQGIPVRQKCFLPIVKAAAAGKKVEILEVGSWAGASAISWAAALKRLGLTGHVTCVDPWLPYFDLAKDGTGHYERMNAAAESGMIYRLFQHNVAASGLGDAIQAKVGTSREILPALASQSFDVIYLDGSHVLEDVLFDIGEAKRLVRRDGIICGDDLELQLADLDEAEVEAAARSGKDYVASGSGEAHYHPGVTLAVGREFGDVSLWGGFWAVRFSGHKGSRLAIDLTGSHLPDHIASAAIKIEGATPTHHLISAQGHYYALAKTLGLPDIAAELVGEEDIPPLLFTGHTLEQVQRKVQKYLDAEAASKAAAENPNVHPSPELIGSYSGFNLVRFQTNVYGLRQSLGYVDLTAGDAAIEGKYDPLDAIIGDTVDGVKARIDVAQSLLETTNSVHVLQAFAGQLVALLPVAKEDQEALQQDVSELRQFLDGAGRGSADGGHAAMPAGATEKLREMQTRIEQAGARARGMLDELRDLANHAGSRAEDYRRELQESIEKLRLQVRSLSEEMTEIQYGPGDGKTPQLVEWYREFKLMRYGRRIYGIRGTLGDVDVHLGDSVLEARFNGEDLVIGDSADGVKVRIDAVEADRAVKSLAARVEELEKCNLKS